MATLAMDSTGGPEAPNSKKRRKKGRIIQKGYHKSEREDARRVAAKAFLSGILLDSNIQPRLQPKDLDDLHKSHEAFEGTSSRPISSASRHSNAVFLGDEAVNSTDISGEEGRLYEMGLDSLAQLHVPSPSKMPPSKSLDSNFIGTPSPAKPVVFSHSVSMLESTPAERRNILNTKRWHSFDSSPAVCCLNTLSGVQAEVLLDSRLVLSAANMPYVAYSVLPYRKDEDKFKLDHPKRARARANSMSLQLDLDVELGTTTDVSLANLFSPLWVIETPQPDVILTPPLHRRQSFKRQQTDVEKKGVLLKAAAAAHMISEVAAVAHSRSSRGPAYPWQSFREHHSVKHVLLHYHPRCLDNYEYFIGRNTTTMTLDGYRVSIVQYAKKSDMKKGINEQFSDVFPYIKVSLTKLRSIKREMQRVGSECDVDMAAIAYSYVYFEKLVLMGKINKANRKIVAGTCLLLAAKFFTDIKRSETKQLIERIADVFRISSKELVLYELPVLVSLQFSLLTPTHQALPHYERLKEMAQT